MFRSEIGSIHNLGWCFRLYSYPMVLFSFTKFRHKEDKEFFSLTLFNKNIFVIERTIRNMNTEINAVDAAPAERTVDNSQPVTVADAKQAFKKSKKDDRNQPDMNTNPASLQGGGAGE